MFCLKCGKEIDDHATFCPYCNSATENAAGFQDFETNNTRPVSDRKEILAIVFGAVAIVLSLISDRGLGFGIGTFVGYIHRRNQ